MSGDDGSTSIQLGGGCRLAVHGGQLNAGGQLGSSGVRLLPRLPDSGGDGSCGNGGDPLSAGHFRKPTGLTGHASSPVGPAGPIGAGDVRSHHGLCGGAGFTSPPGLITGSPLDPRGVRSSPGLIGAAGNGVAGNAPIFMSRSGATGSFPFTSPIFNPNVSSPFAVPGNAAQWIAQDPVSPFHINGHHSPHMTQFLMHPPNLEGPGSSFIASQVTQTKSIPGNFAIGSLQSLLHHVSSSAAGVGRVRATSICDGSDQLLSAQSSLDGSHVQTCGYSAWNDGMHQVTASSPIDQEVDDVPGQDSSDSDTEDPLQDEHIDADAEDSDGSSEDAVPINNQSTLQGSANGSSEDAVPIDNQSTPQGPADEDALLQYEIVSIPPGDDGRVSNKLGYKKRVRVPKGVTIPNERPPRAIGTIEKAMRNAKNRNGKPIFEPVLGMVFDSTAEAYKFYNLYSWERGFGIRFGTNSTNPGNKKRTKQLIVCEKEGFDPRCKSSSKRSHCKAMLQLHRTEDHGWYVSKHVAEHNHPLSILNAEKREWRSHGEIEQCTKDMIGYLRDSNVSLSRIHCFMGSMYGSMENIPFNQKSLRAVCTQIAKDQKDDDVAKTLEVFKKMRADDPGFQFSVQLDEEKKIQTLIWTSGRSRSQYHFFGDVVTFDTTYCTNIYKMPFGMFVGVNNHFQSVLYAGVLMRNETAESFKWVFQEFLNLMGGKAPVTILTDQCKAMTKAIREVFPETNHFWCKWHVFKDAPQELGPVYRRNGPFRREFHYVINEMLTVDEFERAWDDLLERYNLRNHPFMERAYAKRQKWAKPWAKDKFCARMASTQRSESANSILKKVVPRNSSMNRFVEQYQKLLFMRASSEQKAEHQTKQFELRAKRVYAIEKHAFKVYTKNCFQLFRAEVDKASQYGVVRHDSGNTFKVTHNNAEIRKDWARSVFTVVVENDGGKYSCECGLYEHFGMLCCHAIKVLIHSSITKIPEAHIMKRWTRSACDFEYADDISGSGVGHLEQGVLYMNALDVVHTVGKDSKSAGILMKYLTIARKEIKDLQEEQMKEKGYVESSGYISCCTSQAEDGDLSGYDSDGQPITRNRYGASGSSAYMSDQDIQNIQAPNVPPKKSGRPIETRIPRMFEKCKKGYKRSSSRNDEGFCDRCNEEGHMRHACKLKPKGATKKKATTSLKPKVPSKKKAAAAAPPPRKTPKKM